jgi:serine/threonine protein kinase
VTDAIRLADEETIVSETTNKYCNLGPLGSGGNASAFLGLATDGPLRGTLFAIKLFRRLSSPERRKGFEDESRFLRHECDHPAVMRVFDAGIHRDKFPFVVAEYLPVTLDGVVTGKTAASPSEKISYALQLLSALAYIDGLDPPVVHRDIKPKNIFIKACSCILGDFGLMKRLPVDDGEDRELLKTSAGAGMPWGYRTPDLVAYARKEAGVTTKSDVFQLGLVLAELFTGTNPLRPAKSFVEQIKLDELKRVPGPLGDQIADYIRSMLAERPEERPAAASLLAPWTAMYLASVRGDRAAAKLAKQSARG